MTTTTQTDAQMKLARECQKKAYKMAVDDVTTFRDYGVQSALLAIQATEARAQGLVDLLRNWMQDGFNSISEHLELVKQTEAAIKHSQHGGERER